MPGKQLRSYREMISVYAGKRRFLPRFSCFGHKVKLVVHIAFLYFVALPILTGQPAYTVQTKFFGIKDGLSDRDVKCLLKDHQGFLWIGTQKGLNRFDGYRFKIYNKENAGLPFDEICVLWEDPEGW